MESSKTRRDSKQKRLVMSLSFHLCANIDFLVLTAQFIGEAVTVIVGSLLPLPQADLKSLEDDPEEWVSTEEQDDQQWEYELRPCSERVLTQISNQYPQYVTPLLTKVFMDAGRRAMIFS